MTTTATTSATTASAATSTVASIVKTLGSGSGVDTVTLVQQLVDAQFAVKNSQLAAKADTLTAQISAVSALKSELTNFDAALKSLVTSGSLTTQPTSSNTSVVTVTATSGAKLAGLTGQLTVNALASAQAATTNTPIPRTTAFNAGTLSLQFGADTTDRSTTPPTTTFTPRGGAAISIAIGTGDATLDGIAAKINAAGAGITATVVTDGIGARLTIKGANGAMQAFTLTGNDADPTATGAKLSTLNVGRNATGTTIGTSASDASVTLDGATFHRSTNSISDLITGVKLDLASVSTTPVTLGSTSPTSSLSTAVNDFVTTFNQLQKIVATDIDPFTGVLKTDSTVNAIARSLAKLTTTTLATPTTTGAPRTLADLGVTTSRDGTLAVDSTKLAAAITKYPDAVEALFAYGKGAATNDGIAGALSAIVKQATVASSVSDQDLSLDASTRRLTDAQSAIADAQTKAADLAATTKTRMTAQFAKMDSAVAAYKSTQAFLTQQIDAWNSSDN
ncbi:flagellar filament capping protein FliD [Sphingomonas sp. PB2P19]|uniref:flagellar filament capping protein FliD n=1 Tax=Sphingomonas rhamnosi TaxID=3096156 RepID=UPI002FCB1347